MSDPKAPSHFSLPISPKASLRLDVGRAGEGGTPTDDVSGSPPPNGERTPCRHSAEAVVAAARTWIGTPYHHQASLKGVGADCLGLIRGVWRDLYGTEAERPPGYSRDWGEASGQETLIAAATRHLVRKPPAQAEPGDVLVFRMRDGAVAKHAAVLATPDTIVHAIEDRLAAEIPYTAWWRRRVAAVYSFPGMQT